MSLRSVSFNTWLVWLLSSAFYGYQYILRILPNVINTDLTKIFNITASDMGLFSGIYYIGYAVMHIPISILLDRIGPRKIIPLSILLCVVGAIPIIYSTNWQLAILGRLVLGIGSTGSILGIFKVIQLNFPTEYFTRMLGISIAMGLFGAIYGGQPLKNLLDHFGLFQGLNLILGVGLILALICYLVIPNLKSHQIIKPENMGASLKYLSKQYKVLIICCLGGLMIGPLEGFADSWSKSFFENVYGFESGLAASMSGYVFLSMLIGTPIMGFVGDKTRAYYGLSILCALGMALSFVILLMGTSSYWLIVALLSCVGVLSSFQLFVIYKASVLVVAQYTGIARAVANLVIMAFGQFFHVVIGYVMDKNITSYSDGLPVYSQKSYAYGLAVIPICLFVSAVGFWVLRGPLITPKN